MSDFKSFLNEAKKSKIKPTPVGSDKRKAKTKEFLQFLVDLDTKAKSKIYGKGSKALATHSAFPGKTGHYFDGNVQDKTLKGQNTSLGALQVMVPDNTKSHLDKHLKGEIGNFQVVKVDKKPSKYTATLKHIKDGTHHEINFGLTKFENGEPTPFARWSQAAHMTDAGYRLPTSARHVLLGALTAAKGHGPGYVKQGKSYEYHDNVEKHSFSMRDGLRKKHVPTKDLHLGVPVFKRAEPNEPITDVPKILKALVGKAPRVGEVKDSEHFHGVAKFAATNLSAPEKKLVAKKFQAALADKKFHKDPTKDTYQRKLISNHFSTHFGKYMNKAPRIVEEKTLTTIKKLRNDELG